MLAAGTATDRINSSPPPLDADCDDGDNGDNGALMLLFDVVKLLADFASAPDGIDGTLARAVVDDDDDAIVVALVDVDAAGAARELLACAARGDSAAAASAAVADDSAAADVAPGTMSQESSSGARARCEPARVIASEAFGAAEK